MKSPIKILLLDTGKEWGGGTNSMIELLKRLDPQQFAITALFYRNYPKGQTSDLRQELAKYGIPLKIEAPRPQPFWAKLLKELVRGLSSLKLPGLQRWRKRALHTIECRWRIEPAAQAIAARLQQGQYDLLYMNNQPASNLEGYLAAAMTGIPVVQHCRIEASVLPEEAAIINRTAKRILCVSEGVRQSLLDQGISPVLCQTIHNAIDGKQQLPPVASLPALPANTVVIGSVGSLIKRKANDHLLRAAAAVKQRCPVPFHLLLLGEGPERSALEQQATSLGLADHATFAGFQSTPLAWMQGMDIFVLASAKEGLPRVILEAMLLEKPVIASDIIGSRELVRSGETGYLYPYGDEARLATHLEQLLNNPAQRQQFGTTGRTIVLQDFSIETYVSHVAAALYAAVQA